MSDLHIHESYNINPRTKKPPQVSSIPVPFTYSASDDGTDENLLVLLHGLGRQLKLPQTATLALRAPEQIPYLYEQAFQWYTSFDPLGELIDRPNPTPALDLISRVLDHLVQDCAWPPQRIHFFGFAQGGSVAVEFGLKWWKGELQKQKEQQSTEPYVLRPLGSIVSVSGPLLSYPTLSTTCPTTLLVFHRPSPAESALPSGAITAFKKAYSHLVEVKMGGGDGMPRSRDEWEPIMRFWNERLGRRQIDGLYEVMSGTAG
ncbi:hypothetical protein AcV5_009598 [Taiwanofungus camphoratus]|nr:hypothetical protein AcV5_009598 [Antrodia cinnamomea]